MKKGSTLRAMVMVTILMACFNSQSSAQNFKGDVVAKWLETRQMQLMEPFTFVDTNGVEWAVPKGTLVDGASIPRVLWSAVGAPYSGKYRKASVIHDYFCDTMTRPWQDVHKAFFEAALAEGNGETMSKMMYAAVYRWGPRWEYVNGKAKRVRKFLNIATPAELKKLWTWIQTENPSIEEITRRLDKLRG